MATLTSALPTVRSMPPLLRDWGGWAIAGTWLGFWLLGHPLPHVDDLFFTGTGIELARTGRFENPWLGAWMETFGTRLYLVHPPFFPYFVAAWVSVFGSTTASLTGFHCLASCATSLALYHGLRWHGVAASSAVAAVVPLILLLLSMGMRPDSAALLLVVLAQHCFAGRGTWRWILGTALSAAAVLTQSFTVALIVPLFLWQAIRATRAGAHVRVLAGSTAVGLGITFVLFCWALPTTIAEFLRVYLLHARLVTTSLQESAAMVWAALSFGREPLRQGPGWMLIGAALVFALRRNSPAGGFRSAWGVLGGVAVLGSVLYATYTVRYVHYAGLILAIATFGASVPTRRAGPALALLAVAWSNTGMIAGWVRTPPPADPRPWREAVARQPGQRLLVDAVAARVVFDFQLPRSATDWSFRLPAGQGYGSSIRDKRPDEIWLVSAWRLEQHVPDAGIQAPRLRFLGHTFNSVDGDPARLHLIP